MRTAPTERGREGRTLMPPAGLRGAMIDTADRQKVYSILDSRFEDFVRELSDFTRVATISAQGTKLQEGAAATRRILEGHGEGQRDARGGRPARRDRRDRG